MHNIISFVGILVLVGVGWLFSANRKNVNYRLIGWGIGLQLLFALFIFKIPAGIFVFDIINRCVIKLLSFPREGISFLFGPLAIPPGEKGSLGFILAFQALPTIIFFSALMSLLYYIRLMPLVVKGFSFVFTKLMRISGAESLCAASNIFVGIESAFTIKPYINRMTKSELCTILACGMGTIASTVLALYTSFLISEFPKIAGHLVSASILSAPAVLIMAKLLLPEDEEPETLGKVVEPHYERPESWVEAVITGATEGVKLCVGICALLLAFLGLLAMVNWITEAVIGQNLQKLLSYIFYPLCAIMGVPLQDVPQIAYLLGERAIVTELVAYQHLSGFIADGLIQDPRSTVIATYALCGFAHIASLAIFVGGYAAIAAERRKDLAKTAFRALFAATLGCLMTGAVAGVFYSGTAVLGG